MAEGTHHLLCSTEGKICGSDLVQRQSLALVQVFQYISLVDLQYCHDLQAPTGHSQCCVGLAHQPQNTRSVWKVFDSLKCFTILWNLMTILMAEILPSIIHQVYRFLVRQSDLISTIHQSLNLYCMGFKENERLGVFGDIKIGRLIIYLSA